MVGLVSFTLRTNSCFIPYCLCYGDSSIGLTHQHGYVVVICRGLKCELYPEWVTQQKLVILLISKFRLNESHLLTGKSPADLPQKESRLQFRNLVKIESKLINWLEKVTELSLEKRFQNALEAKEALTSDNFIYNLQNNPFIINSKFSNTKPINYPITYSLIEIDKSNGELKIKLPAGGLQRLDEILDSGCLGLLSYFILFCVALFFTIFIPGLSYLLLVLLLLGIGFLLSSKTEILIDRHTGFHIKRKLWGREYNKQTCPIKLIDNVFVQRTGSIFQVGVQANYSHYNLGSALDQNEATWVVQEIKNYLNL